MQKTINTLPDDIRAELREPLPIEAVSPHPSKDYLHTIKPIYIIERLNDVFGIGGWRVRYEAIEIYDRENNWVVIKAQFELQEYPNIYIEQYGGNDNPDIGDRYKGAATDALTKVASYLEIGIDIYKDKWEQEVSAITNDAIAKAQKTKTIEELEAVWNEFSYLHNHQTFIDAINLIKKEYET